MTREAVSPDALETALVSLILSRHPALVHADELARAFAGDDWQAAASALVADGLIHRENRLYAPTRAAVRMTELLT